MRVELVVEGTKELARGLSVIENNWQPEVERDLDVAAEPLDYALSEYAPERPGSDYERTFDYLRSVDVHTELTPDGVELVATHGPEGYWLRGDGNTYEGAWMHRGRWRTLREIIERFVPATLSGLERRLQSWIKLVLGD